MDMNIKYRHTSINSLDWRKLSAFYQRVFHCVPMKPGRKLYGEWFDKLTGLNGAYAEGEHLLLPGHEEDNPCLEIFTYKEQLHKEAKAINCLIGYAHLCFEVENVEETYEILVQEGGSANGTIVTKFYPELNKTAKLIYAKDPEGNNVEILCWSDFKDRYPSDSCVYRHTNINVSVWSRTVDFYRDVFICTPVFPTRDISGSWFAEVTGVSGAALKGQHIEVPGYSVPPTLEVFTYENALPGGPKAINETGITHICFEVEDLKDVMDKALLAGAKKLGEVVSEYFPSLGKTLNAVYIKDPEGNIIELSCWR